MPFQQEVDGPALQRRISGVLRHVGIFPPYVLVAGDHIEISTREIAFILIGGLKHARATATLPLHGGTDFDHPVVVHVAIVVHLAKRIIALFHICNAIRRIQMVQIRIGRRCSAAAPPAFRKAVLAVHAAPTVAHVTTRVGIHVPPRPVAANVGIAKTFRKQARIAVFAVVLYDFVQFRFERTILQSGNAIVVAIGYFRSHESCHRQTSEKR